MFNTLLATILGIVMATSATSYPNYGSALEASKKDGKPVVVAFTATWCGPCKSFKANTLADAGVKKELEDNFHFYLMDTDDEPGLAKKFGIGSIPNIKVIDSNENVKASGGPMGIKSFLDFLKKYRT